MLPIATSVDGHRFSFQAGVNGLTLRLGGYAMLVELRGRSDTRVAGRWEALAGGIAVRSATSGGDARLRLRFAELDTATQGRCRGSIPSPIGRSTPSSRHSWRRP